MFDYLLRFVDTQGDVVYGNLPEQISLDDLVGSKVQLLTGDPLTGFQKTDETRTVKNVRCPLDSTPVFQCIGVNYPLHAVEGGDFKVPSQPMVFTKPADSKADCKDVTEETALDYVLGYTTGNDISARDYVPQEISGFQMSYGKSFDAFAPFGPYIVSPAIVGDPHKLQLVTKVNGEVRQNDNTSNMIWNIKQIIVHLTRGRTVRAGTVCMTGTPSGVGWFMKPSCFFKDGDIVEVTIEKVGTIRNKIVF
ncbi:hypothetical protein B7463_g8980, partial [Scytalidium lignicola]